MPGIYFFIDLHSLTAAPTSVFSILLERQRMYNRTHEHKNHFVRLQVTLLPAGIFRVAFDPEVVHEFEDLGSRISLLRPI